MRQELHSKSDIFQMARLVLLLVVLGLLSHCRADPDLEEETESLNIINLGEAGAETSGDSEVDVLILENNTGDGEGETGDSDGGGGEFVDPADFVGSEVTEREIWILENAENSCRGCPTSSRRLKMRTRLR